jgi:hypothetical protein
MLDSLAWAMERPQAVRNNAPALPQRGGVGLFSAIVLFIPRSPHKPNYSN